MKLTRYRGRDPRNLFVVDILLTCQSYFLVRSRTTPFLSDVFSTVYAVRPPPNSCLVEWLIHAGVSRSNAFAFEQNAIQHSKTFTGIVAGGYQLYNNTLLASDADSQAIHDCASKPVLL